jgi:23S rRNA (cytidine2498-2'-O)-methyltransferase
LSILQGYLAFPGFLDQLAAELRFAGVKPKKMSFHGNLILVDGFRRKPVWASNVWGSIERVEFESITDAARKLKALGVRWTLYPHVHHRRAELIAREVGIPKNPPLHFPKDPMPEKKLGSFLLVSPNELLASAHCSQTVPNGELTFHEDKCSPPSRAYLKLWEALTRLGRAPKAGDSCVDLGSCPGGWTWVIAKLGTRVTSVDRTEIDSRVLSLPGVTFLQANAFRLDPTQFTKVDWLFSDVICEPTKLLELVKSWLIAHPNANCVCSVKFKGESDFRVLDGFRRIPGSSLIHLSQNKNEVTWARLTG